MSFFKKLPLIELGWEEPYFGPIFDLTENEENLQNLSTEERIIEEESDGNVTSPLKPSQKTETDPGEETTW